MSSVNPTAPFDCGQITKDHVECQAGVPPHEPDVVNHIGFDHIHLVGQDLDPAGIGEGAIVLVFEIDIDHDPAGEDPDDNRDLLALRYSDNPRCGSYEDHQGAIGGPQRGDQTLDRALSCWMERVIDRFDSALADELAHDHCHITTRLGGLGGTANPFDKRRR
jgi:hypothetical protein